MDQDLIAYLDRRFSSLDERVERQFQTLREETAQGFANVDQRLDALETDVRRAYVAIEDLRDDVRLVAEGVTNVNERLDRYQGEVSQRFDGLESLLNRSYEDLDSRVHKLEKAG